jgi:glycosyltransferase involved in cell wall biosynthesis
VACATGGLLDLIQDDKTGILVTPGSVHELSRALRTLIDEPARANAIGDAGREFVRQRYAFERMVSSFEDLYSSGLRGRVTARAHEAKAAGI